jgi:hypothetical protein
MRRRALQVVLRLRHLAVDEAKRALAEHLAAETSAEAAEQAAQSAIRREAEVASALEAGDGAVEAFAAWLPRGQAALDQARRRREEVDLAVTRTRAAVERLLATQDAAQAAEGARREQAALDETARNQHQRRIIS